MKLYYCPGACSLADHIALTEVGAAFEREAVDLRTKRTAGGVDFNTVAAKGYVPVLVLDDGQTLTENIAVLDWIAARHPSLSAPGDMGRTRVLEALAYISTEIHRSFKPMWHHGSDAEVGRARAAIARQLGFLADGAQGDYLFGDAPTVADFYFFVMLLWATRFDVPMTPTLLALRDRIAARPAVRSAMAVEGLTL